MCVSPLEGTARKRGFISVARGPSSMLGKDRLLWLLWGQPSFCQLSTHCALCEATNKLTGSPKVVFGGILLRFVLLGTSRGRRSRC